MNNSLIQAVKDQLGGNEEKVLETLQDVARSSADAGWSGFTWYNETCKFFKDNRKDIIDLLNEYADDFGQDVISLVASFGCLKTYCADRDGKDEIGRAIYGRPAKDDTQVPNALAWFALEEVARYVTDN